MVHIIAHRWGIGPQVVTDCSTCPAIKKWVMVVIPFEHITLEIFALKLKKKILISKVQKFLTQELLIQEDLMLLLWKFWQDLKNPTLYVAKLYPGTSYLENTVFCHFSIKFLVSILCKDSF